MQQKDIKLLFDAGNFRACIIVSNDITGGYNALFPKKGEIKPSVALETRPRKSGDTTEIRRFKTIDSACNFVKRNIGFKDFVVDL